MKDQKTLASFQRLKALIKELAIQAKATDSNNKHRKEHTLLADNALFSQELFVTLSDKFTPYVKEIEKKAEELNRLIALNKNEFAFNQLPKLEQQISSLVNALHANKSMHNEAQLRLNAIKTKRYKKAAQSVMQSSHSLHKKLAEYHEFERRLLEMIREREQLRAQTTSAKVLKNLPQEVLALHQRLGRCRQAISKTERQIEFSEKRLS